MTWHLIVKTIHGEHRVFVGSEEDARGSTCGSAGAHRRVGPVEVASRLALRAQNRRPLLAKEVLSRARTDNKTS
jgi:hypothetical protein